MAINYGECRKFVVLMKLSKEKYMNNANNYLYWACQPKKNYFTLRIWNSHCREYLIEIMEYSGRGDQQRCHQPSCYPKTWIYCNTWIHCQCRTNCRETTSKRKKQRRMHIHGWHRKQLMKLNKHREPDNFSKYNWCWLYNDMTISILIVIWS